MFSHNNVRLSSPCFEVSTFTFGCIQLATMGHLPPTVRQQLKEPGLFTLGSSRVSRREDPTFFGASASQLCNWMLPPRKAPPAEYPVESRIANMSPRPGSPSSNTLISYVPP